MKKNLSEIIEEDTYQIINEIADELDLKIPFYPEVYLMHKNFKFDFLGLPEGDRNFVEDMKKNKRSCYLYDSKIILIGKKDRGEIAEEAGHFLHFANSKLNFNNRSSRDLLLLNSLIEMIGFFSSRLIYPNRKNYFSNYPDIIREREACMEKLANRWIKKKKIDLNFISNRLTKKQKIENIANQYVNIREFTIYQQGYGLGENLFNSYISELIPAKDIKKLMLKTFKKTNSVIEEFIKLKYITLTSPRI